MTIKPIRSDAGYSRALLEIDRLWGSREGTTTGDRLEVLVTLAEAYEREHYPVGPPDPIDAIRFRLEQQGLDQRALVGIIGSRARVSEVMTGKRGLSLAMIRRLHEHLRIPAESLIRPISAGKRAA